MNALTGRSLAGGWEHEYLKKLHLSTETGYFKARAGGVESRFPAVFEGQVGSDLLNGPFCNNRNSLAFVCVYFATA